MESQEIQCALNSKAFWRFFINVNTFGRVPPPSVFTKTILVASDKNQTELTYTKKEWRD